MNNYQNIFNRDFYPTPVSVIETMLNMSDIAGKVILEPSFGSGNIVNYLNEHHAKEVLGCEINDTLRRAIKGCTVIGSDFLQIQREDVSHINMIVMNPPFSRQEDHILHAWEIAPDGCEIITLCNSTMLDRYSYNKKEREIREIVTVNGFSENLGNVFNSSEERRTDCDITLIHLCKPGTGESEFDGYFSDEADEPEMQGNGLMPYNTVRECVQRYIAAVNRFDAVMAASKEINDLTHAFGFDEIKFGAYASGYNKSNYETITKDQFKKALQKRAWRWIFQKFHMDRYVTSSVLEQVNAVVEKQSHLPFTMRNIYRMLEMIVGTHADRMQQVIMDAFDIICKFSDENVTYTGEKWKTNSAHMVNKRFIVPYITSYDTRWPTDYVKTSYGGNAAKMTDVVKALCYLTGDPYEKEVRCADGSTYTERKKTLDQFFSDRKLYWGEWHEWTFFRVKGYKKGTMHFEFIDDDVWAMINQAVAKVRGWELPTNTKAKKSKKN